jgi:NADH-quinone oxidoreductase subunit J
MTVGNVFFALCSIAALVGALSTVLAKNPIRGAMGLLLTIVGIAGLFLKLNAQFLAAIQLIVYAGAVVVLFVFVIMLLGPDAGSGESSLGRARIARYGAGGFFVALAAVAAHFVAHADGTTVNRFKVAPAGHGSVDRSKPHARRQNKTASPTARMFHGPLMARDAQRPLPTKAEKAAKAAAGGV